MRKIFSAILLLLVFFTLQYGRVATYLYCKWQAEMVQKLKDCGCESHLAEIFTDKSAEASGPAAIKEFAFEYVHDLSAKLPVEFEMRSLRNFHFYSSSLIERAVIPQLRPPIV